MNGLVFCHLGCDDRVDFITLLTAGKYLSIHDTLIQVWAGKTLLGQVFPVLIRFMGDRHMGSWMAFLAALLFVGFLAQALRSRLVKAIT